MKRLLRTAAFALTALSGTTVCPAAPGDLDLSFGSEGKVNLRIGDGRLEAAAVAIQGDGKILVAGNNFNSSAVQSLAVVRYLADGSVDAAFGTGGLAEAGMAGSVMFGTCVAIQPDGSILVGGHARRTGIGTEFALARFTGAGAVDASFGTAGLVTTDIGPGEDTAYGIALQPDGRILLAGTAVYSFLSDVRVALTRYTSTGALDPAWNGNGKVATPGPGTTPALACNAVALQVDGKVVVAGGAAPAFSDGSQNSVCVARYTTAGSLDSTFNGTGISIQTLSPGYKASTCLALQTDGRMVVGGILNTGGATTNLDFMFVRFNSGGSLDTTFNGTGWATVPAGAGDDQMRGLAVQSDGRIVGGGSAVVGGSDDFAVVRVLADGTPDASFGTGGAVTTAINFGFDTGTALRLQSDGKIVLAGTTYTGSTPRIGMVRYHAAAAVAPAVTTGAATALSASGATLQGSVNPNGATTTARFEYGLTTAYGITAPVTLTPDNGTAAQSVSAVVNGLSPGTLYHFRLAADNPGGPGTGADATFTTLTLSQSWRDLWFNTTAATGAAADDADPDGDGVPNLIEYATNSNPLTSNSQPGTATLTAGGIEFIYPRSLAALSEGITFTVEWSDTMTAGTWTNAGVTETILSSDGVVQQVKAVVPAGPGCRYVRLRVTRP